MLFSPGVSYCFPPQQHKFLAFRLLAIDFLSPYNTLFKNKATVKLQYLHKMSGERVISLYSENTTVRREKIILHFSMERNHRFIRQILIPLLC